MVLDVVKRLGSFTLAEEEEEKGVELERRDVHWSEEICKKSLVGKIYGRKEVNFTGLKNTMAVLWCRTGSLKAIEMKRGIFQFVFSEDEDRKRVLERRPWSFENRALILHQWEPAIEKNEEAFSSTRSWIQVWQIPNQWLSTETGWKIGKLFKN